MPSTFADGFTGVMLIAASTAPVTVKVADPLTLPEEALIVVCPLPTPVAAPLVPVELLTVATGVAEELQ